MADPLQALREAPIDVLRLQRLVDTVRSIQAKEAALLEEIERHQRDRTKGAAEREHGARTNAHRAYVEKEEALDELYECFDSFEHIAYFLTLLSSPVLSDDGWCYDMEAAPEYDDLFLSLRVGEGFYVAPGSGVRYQSRWQWTDSHGRFLRGVYAWKRRLTPEAAEWSTAPPLPAQGGGEE